MKDIIKVVIEIDNVDNWNVDWNNDSARRNELAELSGDVQKALSNHCGIGYSDMKIKSTYEKEKETWTTNLT